MEPVMCNLFSSTSSRFSYREQ